MQELANIHTVKADLIVPQMEHSVPQAGKRVKATLKNYANTGFYHTLYLPIDWDQNKKYPVIVEYAGNGYYKNDDGDISTGKVENSCLGYGLSAGKGAIWLCLPYLNTDTQQNEINWWGDIYATVEYCKKAVAFICSAYGGDESALFIAGFSRGAIACNYIGLHDDHIASLWRGFIAHSHYDGVVTQWPYENSDRNSAQKRLQRLENKAQFISHEVSTSETEKYLEHAAPNGNFTFQPIRYRNHSDTWVLKDIPERMALRSWFSNTLNP